METVFLDEPENFVSPQQRKGEVGVLKRDGAPPL
jgi:hypothetical protein